MFFGDAADRRGVKPRCVVHQPIQAATPGNNRIDQSGQVGNNLQVGLNRHRRVFANPVETRCQLLCIVGGATVVNGDTRAVLVQACHNGRAYAPGSAGDKYDFVVECLLWHGIILKGFVAHMQYEQTPLLPIPDTASAEHSARVADHIRDSIRAAGGQISFAEFMHAALYAPELGYYNAGSTKFGAAGDFITAPEVSSVFGNVVARQCAEVLATVEGGAVLEFGAGSGKLAADMLQALDRLDALPVTYSILEVSADLQQRQESFLQSQVPQLAEKVSWLANMPANHRGVIIANEVLDALPVERFVRRDAGIFQLCVEFQNDKFVQAERPAPALVEAAVVEIEAQQGHAFADGFVSEVSLAVPAWIADVGNCLQQGVAFLFDYGVSRREYYSADRSDGWLRCHFRHHAHNDPYIYPGIQDLTAWVDFSAVAGAAVESGMDIVGYQTQSQFLMGGGLDIEMRDFAKLPLADQVKLSGQVKTLTLPGEMGENFKCIALGRGDVATPSAFQYADRTRTL